MQVADALNTIQFRAERLGFVDIQTGRPDLDEIESYWWNTVENLIDRYDLDEYTVINRNMAVLVDGIETYRLPDDFRRLLLSDHEDISGILAAASDGTSPADMRYVSPREFNGRSRTSEAKPTHFTIAGRELKVNPIPDTTYILQGTYISNITFRDKAAQVPLAYESTLISETLYRMLGDINAVPGELATERAQNLTAMVNGNRRKRMRYQGRNTNLRRVR